MKSTTHAATLRNADRSAAQPAKKTIPLPGSHSQEEIDLVARLTRQARAMPPQQQQYLRDLKDRIAQGEYAAAYALDVAIDRMLDSLDM